jgi:hypothetical protein
MVLHSVPIFFISLLSLFQPCPAAFFGAIGELASLASIGTSNAAAANTAAMAAASAAEAATIAAANAIKGGAYTGPIWSVSQNTGVLSEELDKIANAFGLSLNEGMEMKDSLNEWISKDAPTATRFFVDMSNSDWGALQKDIERAMVNGFIDQNGYDVLSLLLYLPPNML